MFMSKMQTVFSLLIKKASLQKNCNGALTIWIYYLNRKNQYPHTELMKYKNNIFLDIAPYMGTTASNPANGRRSDILAKIKGGLVFSVSFQR